MPAEEEENKPRYIIELFLGEGRYIIISTEDIEVDETP